MITYYECEGCSNKYHDKEKCKEHELVCVRAKDLCEYLTNPLWKPHNGLPIYFNKWYVADKIELLRLVNLWNKKHKQRG